MTMMMDESEPEIQIEYYELHEADPISSILQNDSSSPDSTSTILDKVAEKNYSDLYSPDLKHLYDDEVINRKTTWHQNIESDGTLLCKFCDLKYSTKETLRIHVKRKHPNQYLTLKNSVSKYERNSKNINCRICKKIFNNITDLRNHVNRTHTIDLIKSSCADCYANFDNEIELSIHMFEKHAKDCIKLAFICKICGYRTTKKSHFKQHCDNHSKTNLFLCHFCNYTTNSKSNLTIHKYIHTEEKRFLCDFNGCNLSYGSKSALRAHKLRHFPEKNMLFCDKCSYKTVYRHSLKKHADSHVRNSVRTKN